ncbi:unnamed protein product [Closterium sp. Yama58-4]|nr:unnamed protein product [Closterium sp. Yama58-4]
MDVACFSPSLSRTDALAPQLTSSPSLTTISLHRCFGLTPRTSPLSLPPSLCPPLSFLLSSPLLPSNPASTDALAPHLAPSPSLITISLHRCVGVSPPTHCFLLLAALSKPGLMLTFLHPRLFPSLPLPFFPSPPLSSPLLPSPPPTRVATLAPHLAASPSLTTISLHHCFGLTPYTPLSPSLPPPPPNPTSTDALAPHLAASPSLTTISLHRCFGLTPHTVSLLLEASRKPGSVLTTLVFSHVDRLSVRHVAPPEIPQKESPPREEEDGLMSFLGLTQKKQEEACGEKTLVRWGGEELGIVQKGVNPAALPLVWRATSCPPHSIYIIPPPFPSIFHALFSPPLSSQASAARISSSCVLADPASPFSLTPFPFPLRSPCSTLATLPLPTPRPQLPASRAALSWRILLSHPPSLTPSPTSPSPIALPLLAPRSPFTTLLLAGP